MKAFEEKLFYSGGSRILVARREAESFPFEWHYHRAFEITVILKGEGQRFVGDSIEAYKEGDLVFLPPQLPHTWRSNPSALENVAVYIQFDENCLGKEWLSNEDFREFQTLMKSSSGFSLKLSDPVRGLMIKCLDSQGVSRMIMFLSLLKELNKLERKELSSRLFKPESDTEARLKMDLLMTILNKEDNIRVPDLADELNMSESSFRRFIKKNTGRSFIEFLNMLRVSEASEMLMNSKKPVGEVALDCGINNLSHFNRKFKEYKKLTPREFRNSFTD